MEKSQNTFSITLITLVAIVAIVGIIGFFNNNDNTGITGYAVAKAPADVTKANKDVTVTIPSHAIELAPGVFDLGIAIVDGESVQGYMFIDYKKDFAKPPWAGGKGKEGKTKCYQLFGKGARWKLTEPYVLNPANSNSMSDIFVQSTIDAGLESWDEQTAFDIFGLGTLTTDTLVADTVAPDNKNEVYFGAIEGTGAIAVTIVWGIFSGPPPNRRLVEWDMVFDDTDFEFGDADLNPSVMDFLNIATHEDGHAAGLGHPDDGCTEETMYRFAGFGETKKRTVNTGDIAGVNELYK